MKQRSSTLMAVLAPLVCSLLLLSSLASAQVNFSPSWGKRSSESSSSNGVSADAACRNSMDNILYIYKLVQNEAQRFLECQKYLK